MPAVYEYPAPLPQLPAVTNWAFVLWSVHVVSATAANWVFEHWEQLDWALDVPAVYEYPEPSEPQLPAVINWAFVLWTWQADPSVWSLYVLSIQAPHLFGLVAPLSLVEAATNPWPTGHPVGWVVESHKVWSFALLNEIPATHSTQLVSVVGVPATNPLPFGQLAFV